MNNSDVPQYDPQCDGNRWVAYFDLLGTTARIQRGDQFGVFDAYQQAIERLKRTDHAGVRTAWFSDTFLLATVDDSGRSFTEIEQVSRWFFHFMLSARIPLRGAIACGPMYADFRQQMFVGKAMVEAHEYGENQDWIGLVLCPSAETAMEQLGLSVNRSLRYAHWRPVWKRPLAHAPERIGACVPGVVINGRDQTVEALQLLMASCPSKDRCKYERAIEFLHAHRRVAGAREIEAGH